MISLFCMWGKPKSPRSSFTEELKNFFIQASCPDPLNNAREDLGALK